MSLCAGSETPLGKDLAELREELIDLLFDLFSPQKQSLLKIAKEHILTRRYLLNAGLLLS